MSSEEIKSNDFSICAAPSPFPDYCEISIKSSGLDIVKAELFDVLGNRVRLLTESAVSENSPFTINGEGLTAGVYILSVSNGKDIIRKKIVKI